MDNMFFCFTAVCTNLDAVKKRSPYDRHRAEGFVNDSVRTGADHRARYALTSGTTRVPELGGLTWTYHNLALTATDRSASDMCAYRTTDYNL